jgi:hypothetical protein
MKVERTYHLQMEPSHIREQLLSFIRQRYEAHAEYDLVGYMVDHEHFQAVDPAFVSFAYTQHQNIDCYLSDAIHVDELTEFCIRSTKQYTYGRNQFIHYPKQYEQLLQAGYRDLIGQFKQLVAEANSQRQLEHELCALLRQHHQRLRLILSTYCASYHPDGAEQHPLLQTVACEEYSAEFQLQVLNCDLQTLREPILDVGCGTAARLVRYLRGRGREAFGLDRLPPEEAYCWTGDWLSFDYGVERWGTVTAHHSVSTHFIRHHRHQTRDAALYASLFLRILASLAPGGSFHYAPGLPFFEEHLEVLPGYNVEKAEIAAPALHGVDEVAYATKVTRVSGSEQP